MTFLIVGLGGFLGAITRYLCYLQFSYQGGFPYATLIVNVVGCLLLSLIQYFIRPTDLLWLFFVVGFLGSLTTFSALGWETYQLMINHDYGVAALHVFLNLSLGLLAFLIPFFFTKAIL